jgi:hypothetical protein
MLNTKSLIKKEKIIVQSDKEFEKINIEENFKIIKDEDEYKVKSQEYYKPSIFIPKKLEMEKISAENDDIFKDRNFILKDKIGNILEEEIKKKEDVIYDEFSNSYIIFDYDNFNLDINEKKILKNEDIINYIINNRDNELIKKYIFTINYNIFNKNFEFNFIISKFTENIDIMIKLLNFINDYINNNDNFENIDKLMIFYYQIIIFLFKNILQISKYDKLKLAKYSSYLSYKYSTMVLKKITLIENNNLIIKDTFKELFEIKKDLLTRFTNICTLQKSNLLSKSNLFQENMSNMEHSQILNRSAKYKLSSENLEDKESLTSDSKENIRTIFTESSNKSENKYNINNIMNFFSDDNLDNNISDYNNYQEVDMSSEENILVTEDKLNIENINEELQKISNNSNIPLEISNKDTISENLYVNNLESNKIKSSNIKSKSDYSYNTNSALLNSKLYELNL